MGWEVTDKMVLEAAKAYYATGDPTSGINWAEIKGMDPQTEAAFRASLTAALATMEDEGRSVP